jgi:hypothetical protein
LGRLDRKIAGVLMMLKVVLVDGVDVKVDCGCGVRSMIESMIGDIIDLGLGFTVRNAVMVLAVACGMTNGEMCCVGGIQRVLSLEVSVSLPQ